MKKERNKEEEAQWYTLSVHIWNVLSEITAINYSECVRSEQVWNVTHHIKRQIDYIQKLAAQFMFKRKKLKVNNTLN